MRGTGCALLAVIAIAAAVSAAPREARAQAGPDNFPWRARLWYPLRDVNTAHYEPDFAWQRISERERQTKSGIDFWYGSLSEQRLGVERRLQLNVPLGEAVRFRWQHEELAIEEIRAGSEKIELQFRLRGPLAFTVSGNGVLEKSRAAIGLGLLYAPGDRTNYVDVSLRNDAAVHDARTPYDAKDRQPPLRVLAETNWEHGPARVYGFADWQLESRRVFETPRGSEGIRDRRRFTRRTELKLEWALSEDTGIGVRHRYTGDGDERRHFTEWVDPEVELLDYDFERAHHRADVFGEHRFAPFRVRAIAGWWVQDDHADFAIGRDYAYRRTQFLFGTRVHWAVSQRLELGVGYWGDVMTAVREPSGPPAIARGRREVHHGYYADKADLVLGYRIADTVRLEFLVSQEITRGEFGGGCGKALIFF